MTILILGMHRSGTSAITRLVGDMGAYIAPDALLLPTTDDNPQGFWERKDVLAINRALLSAQNCNWYHIEGFDNTRPPPPELRKPMQACINELSAHASFVVKDPRFCLTLPYWLNSLPPSSPRRRGSIREVTPAYAGVTIILALRHPASVAHSLHLRNAMPLEQGLELWENYMTQALENIEGLPIIKCHYEKLMANPEHEIAALHAALAARFPSLKLPAKNSLNPALVRALPDIIGLSATQQALYNLLVKQP